MPSTTQDGSSDRHGSTPTASRNTRSSYSNGSLTDLDSFGSSLSNADGIADGTTVGYFTLADGVSTHAFVHTDADGTADLNTRIPSDSGWTLTKAQAISTSGRIVGEGLLNGQPHVFRLTPPVPPPLRHHRRRHHPGTRRRPASSRSGRRRTTSGRRTGSGSP